MGRLIAWRHDIERLSKVQHELIKLMGFEQDVVYLVPPGTSRTPDELEWYSRVMPSRDWSVVSPMIELGAAESKQTDKAFGNPPSGVRHHNTALETMELFMREIVRRNISSALIWNGWQVVPRVLKETMRNLGRTYLFAEQGLLPGSLCLDPCGVLDHSSLTHLYWEHLVDCGLSAQEHGDTLEAIEVVRNRSAALWGSGSVEATNKLLGNLNSDRPTVLVIGQLDWDSNILQSSPTYPTNKSMVESLRSLSEIFHIIYKPHPRDPRPYKPGGTIIDGSNLVTSLLVQKVHAVVLRTSTVGIEAVLHEKPVVVLGDTIYNRRGFTIDVRDPSQLLAAVQQAASAGYIGNYWTPDRMQRRLAFFHWLLFTHLFFDPAKEPLPGMSQRAAHAARAYLEK